jgi:hypothetical protein
MGTDSPLILRIPLILLAAANLAILGQRLLPWHDVVNLPVNGTTAIDPAVVLVAYIVLAYWIPGSHDKAYLKALSTATIVGLLAGALLIAEVMLGVPLVTGQPSPIQMGLLVAAGILAGIAGLLGSRATRNPGAGIVTGVWSAMTGCLMACTAVLVNINFAAPEPLTQDPWKQYQGLAIGNQATQLLVHSLLTATGFILIGPLVGGAVGFIFALFGQKQES